MGAPGPTPRGRAPVGDCRVGCIGRRSPGRNGGRGAPPGTCGRGRWKIGWPGTGRPGAGRDVPPIGSPGCTGFGGGALYTGRGPVWGTIMRGGGAIGAAGFTDAAATGGLRLSISASSRARLSSATAHGFFDEASRSDSSTASESFCCGRSRRHDAPGSAEEIASIGPRSGAAAAMADVMGGAK